MPDFSPLFPTYHAHDKKMVYYPPLSLLMGEYIHNIGRILFGAIVLPGVGVSWLLACWNFGPYYIGHDRRLFASRPSHREKVVGHLIAAPFVPLCFAVALVISPWWAMCLLWLIKKQREPVLMTVAQDGDESDDDGIHILVPGMQLPIPHIPYVQGHHGHFVVQGAMSA
jgi:hypothetical protein